MTFTQFTLFLEQRKDAMVSSMDCMPPAPADAKVWIRNVIIDDFRSIFDNLACLERDTIANIAQAGRQ